MKDITKVGGSKHHPFVMGEAAYERRSVQKKWYIPREVPWFGIQLLTEN